ncbi:MAG TPA: hypothetical protein PLQ80_03405 [Candidatus Syntrophosphaera sp.]|nr:hypothetical protein [Candidatus Syntrophosphaera sp.]
MIVDSLIEFRKKTRMIVEFRFKPISKIIDNRGHIVDGFISKAKYQTSKYKITNLGIVIQGDTSDVPTNILIEPTRLSVDFEGHNLISHFDSEVKNVMAIFANSMSLEAFNIRRVGVRFISIFGFHKLLDYNKLISCFMASYLNDNFPLSIKPGDLKFVFTSSNSNITLGPVKDDDKWITDNFSNKSGAPKVGIGLDVDSFITKTIDNISIQDVLGMFEKLEEVTLQSETEAVNPFRV